KDRSRQDADPFANCQTPSMTHVEHWPRANGLEPLPTQNGACANRSSFTQLAPVKNGRVRADNAVGPDPHVGWGHPRGGVHSGGWVHNCAEFLPIEAFGGESIVNSGESHTRLGTHPERKSEG